MSIDDAVPHEWDMLQAYIARINEVHCGNEKEPDAQDIKKMFPEAFADMQKVVDLGGRKYGYGSFLDHDNPSLQRKANHASMSRHLAEGYMGVTADKESGVHPYLHLAVRALMAYTRVVRNIKDADQHQRD